MTVDEQPQPDASPTNHSHPWESRPFGDRQPHEQSLRDLVRRVARRRWLLLFVFVAAFGGVTAYTFLVTPLYQSGARLRIDTDQQPGSALTDQMSSVPGASLLGLARDELETEIGVLRSDRVADAMIDTLALGVQLKTPAGNRARILRARVVDPAVDVDGKLTLRRQGSGHYAVEDSGLEDVRSVPATIAAGDSIRVGGDEVTFSPDLAQPGPEKIVVQFLPRYKVHKLLDRRLSIERQEGGSRLVEITFEDPDRALAAQVVNRIVAEYVGYTNHTLKTADTLTVAELRGEVASTLRRLTQAETALRAFEEKARIVAPEEQATAQVKRLSEISTKVDQISIERNALARMLTLINQRSKGGADVTAYRQLATFPSLIGDKGIQDLLQSLLDLENKLSELGVRRTDANTEYKQLSDRIADIERQLYQVGPQYLEGLDQELATTAQTVAELTDTLVAMPAAAMEYGRLLRDRTLGETTYLALQKQLKQAELKDELRQDRVHVIDAPRVANAKDPAFPKKSVMLMLGALFGAALAVTTALALELWRAPSSPIL